MEPMKKGFRQLFQTGQSVCYDGLLHKNKSGISAENTIKMFHKRDAAQKAENRHFY